jgi:hypothetical protein
MRYALAAILIVLGLPPAIGQEFQPYASTLITDEQWQMYFYEVQGSEGKDVRPLDAQHLLVFTDAARNMSWIFTQIGHPAHPGWITRRIVGDGENANIQQIGYFAGSEAAFAVFFEQYLELNKKISRGEEN